MYNMNIELDIVYEKQNIGYTAYVPALPGCISEGETKKETEKNIKEAIKLYLEEIDKDKISKFKSNVSVKKTMVNTNA